jgi:hypothetical protein
MTLTGILAGGLAGAWFVSMSEALGLGMLCQKNAFSRNEGWRDGTSRLGTNFAENSDGLMKRLMCFTIVCTSRSCYFIFDTSCLLLSFLLRCPMLSAGRGLDLLVIAATSSI